MLLKNKPITKRLHNPTRLYVGVIDFDFDFDFFIVAPLPIIRHHIPELLTQWFWIVLIGSASISRVLNMIAHNKRVSILFA